MIDRPAPSTTGGELPEHAAYFERRACALAQLATQALGLGQLAWWKLWTIEANTAAQIARRIRARLALVATPMHVADCPISNCQTCQKLPYTIVSSAAHLGRKANLTDSVSQVACWMRDAWPDAWYDEEIDPLLARAEALIHLRDAVEAGRWGSDR